MKKILIRGPLLSESGYGNHARQVFRWILNKHPEADIRVQVLPWGTTSWHVNPDSEGGLIGEIMKRTGDVSQKFDISFQIQLPNEWDIKLANINIGISAIVEADKCNPKWIDACNAMNMVIVPSSYCQKTLQNSGNLTVPTHVIPESFIPEVVNENNRFNEDFETDFNFLVVGTITGNNPLNDRKNIFFTIKWLCEEFKNDSDVGIILKTNIGRGTKLDWPGVENMLKKAISEVRQGPFPKIHIVHGIMSNAEIAGLYRHPKVKALVTATRGEGFGLPILEAAASALPVIATEQSGHMDFMKSGKFTKLEYDMKPIHESRQDENIWMPGSNWAEVREADFKKKVRKFRVSSAVPKEWAQELAKKLLISHSPESIDSLYENLIGKIIN
jgi:glycosyltransferase involved in cell wall biosynthesis